MKYVVVSMRNVLISPALLKEYSINLKQITESGTNSVQYNCLAGVSDQNSSDPLVGKDIARSPRRDAMVVNPRFADQRIV